MRSKLTILALLAFAAVFVAIVSPPAGGDCDSGIKAVHLDPDPNDFCDDVTIEISDTNGLQVKDGGITAAKIANIPDSSITPAKIDSIFGSWTDKDSDLNTFAQNNIYKATSDGFVCMRSAALNSGGGSIAGYTDGSNPPTTLRSYCVTGAVYATHPVLPEGLVPHFVAVSICLDKPYITVACSI